LENHKKTGRRPKRKDTKTSKDRIQGKEERQRNRAVHE
jgi:hypothetical protein